MKVHFLGSGTSTGNPEIGCRCKVCCSTDKKDRRLRASALVEVNERRLLIDCGPDFRWQALRAGIASLDAVLITHEHYDHVGGLDDLRPFCKRKNMDVYAEDYVVQALKERIPYAFREKKYPGVPSLDLHIVRNDKPFSVKEILITPIRLMHGRLPIFGYRIGNMAYLTDFNFIPEEEYAKLQGLDVLIIDALRDEKHISHETVEEALRQIETIRPKQSYLIHMSHHFGLHVEREKQLPEKVFVSYDGLELSLP